MIVKSVCAKRSSCACAAATTCGCECPTFRQPTPPVKSMKVFPSTSVSVAPLASSTTTGRYTDSGSATTRSLRSRISRDRGPGIAVFNSIVRVIAMALTLPQRPGAGAAGRPPLDRSRLGGLGSRLLLAQAADQVGDVGGLLLEVALVLLERLQPFLPVREAPAAQAARPAATVVAMSVCHVLTSSPSE